MRLNEFTEQNIEEAQQQMSRAAKGHEKYGKAGMEALAKAGRDGASDEQLDKIRDKHDKYAESVEQGVAEAGIPFRGTAGAFNRGDDERHDLDVPRPTIYALKINGKIWQKDGNTVTFFTKERALAARNSILAKRPELEVGLVQRQD